MSRYLVTGGSRGIGRAICLRLARDALARGQTPKIVVTATGGSQDLANLEAELRTLGAQASGIPGDLNDPQVPARLVQHAVEFCGGLDAVVHNAGGSIAATLLKATLADWDTVFAVNCRAFWLLGVAAQQALRESKGALVAIGSGAAETPQPFLNAYSPAKAALVMLVQLMAIEWGRYGIRVNCVSPGWTSSRSTEVALADPGDKARAGEMIPLGRIGEGEEIAGAIAFVIGADAGYLTGENINVDGGVRHMGMDSVIGQGAGNWAAQRGLRNMRPGDKR